MQTLEQKTAEAIRFIQRHSKNHASTLMVGFSGGKDSVVIAKLCELAGIDYRLVHSLTGVDMPEVVQFIRKQYPDCQIVRPKQNFWHSITTRNPPLPNYRWCCTTLKKQPSHKLPYKLRVMGIRKEESRTRARYPRVNYFEKLDHTHIYPIFEWNEAEVWEFIEQYNLPVPSIYNEGICRGGCIVCPYHSQLEYETYRKKYPAVYRLFERQVGKWFAKRKAQGRDMAYDSAQAFLDDWYKHKAIWYRNTTKKAA